MQNWRKEVPFAREAAALLCHSKARNFAGFESKCLHVNQKSQSLVGVCMVPGRLPGPHHGGSPAAQAQFPPQLTCSPTLWATRAAPSSASASLRGRIRRATCTHSTCTWLTCAEAAHTYVQQGSALRKRQQHLQLLRCISPADRS